MAFQVITVISQMDGDLQAWTFQIDEQDLSDMVGKYSDSGCSVRGDAESIASEVLDIYA